MGYGFYFVSDHAGGQRPAGYMVTATCDKRGCENVIDRGLGYLCGESPHDIFDMEPGCGRYFCSEHLGSVGPRGGCSHGRRARDKAWGRTLSDMAQAPDGTYCLDPIGHDGEHAWAREP